MEICSLQISAPKMFVDDHLLLPKLAEVIFVDAENRVAELRMLFRT